mgnify:CR=1 FL=1
MKLLTTKKERGIVMEQLRPVSKTEKVIFPIAVTGIVGIILPSAIPLLGMLMLGNLMKESGVVPRLTNTAKTRKIVSVILTIIIPLFVLCAEDSKQYACGYGRTDRERLRALKKAMPNTKLQMLFRGQNILGYKHYADDVVDEFVKKTIENGSIPLFVLCAEDSKQYACGYGRTDNACHVWSHCVLSKTDAIYCVYSTL